MKISDRWLINYIGEMEQGKIPIFQRDYKWETKHCKRLVEDIINAGNDSNRDCHFLGSIIYKQEKINSGVQIRQIIDGQQRLTTVSLLLLALLDYCDEFYTLPSESTEYGNTKNQLNNYLFNNVSQVDLKMKLHLNGDAHFEYETLLNDRIKGLNQSTSKFVTNYKYMLEQIREKNLSPKVFVEGIQKLRIVDIEVEAKDDAHLIFETVNGTGLALIGSELIKNYILMTVPSANQDNLYIDSWRPMEQGLPSDKEFDDFFRYYLMTVTQEEIEKDARLYYESFKKYAYKKDTEDLVRNEICKYYKCYMLWRNASKPDDDDFQNALYYLNKTKNNIITPVVLFLLYRIENLYEEIKNETDNDKKKSLKKDLEKKKKDYKKIIAMIESYFVRLKLCEIDSKNIGDVWLKMLIELQKTCDVSSIIKVINDIKNTNQHMPTDAELDSHLENYKIYNKRNWCRYILDRIERKMNKDYHHDSQWSIEHILPQHPKSKDDLAKMSPEVRKKYNWIKGLGEDGLLEAMAYVDTIGNLTLSGYNPDYQNLIFIEKRNMGDNPGEEKKGYKYSPIRMNEPLKTERKWNKDTILKRKTYMGKQIKKIWPYPKMSTGTP